MRKTVYLLLTALLLGLTACGPVSAKTPTPSPDPAADAPTLSPDLVPESPTPTPTAEPIFLLQEADVPPGEYEPWQEAYADFLRQLRQREGELEDWFWKAEEHERNEKRHPNQDQSGEYYLYDVDKGGIPELLVSYRGTEPGSEYGVCYTFRDGRVSETGELFPDTEEIPGYRTRAYNGRWEACTLPNLLPVYDYGAPPRQNPTPAEEAEVQAAIGKVLWEGAMFFGTSGDGFDGYTERITLEEYLGLVAQEGNGTVTLTRCAWADVNGDGQTDCILNGKEIDGLGYTHDGMYIVLSLEEDTVYAYYFGCNMENFAVTADGTVYVNAGSGKWGRESFYKNQCYCYPVQAPAEWDDLAWEEFSQTP